MANDAERDNIYSGLLQELRIVSGLSLEKGIQCKELSDDIFFHLGERISWQSLRRVLGFIKSDSAISLPILDIIARYLGFSNYSDFLISRSRSESGPYTDSIFNFMKSVYDIPLKKEMDLNYHFVCRNFSKIIYNQPDLLLKLPAELFSNRAFQLYFIERFPLMDLLNHGFSQILLQYREKANRNDVTIFVNCLLYLNSHYLGRPNEKWLDRLPAEKIESIHPLLQGRHFGSRLLACKNSGEKNRHIDIAKEFISLNQEKGKFPYFLFTFLEYALRDGRYDIVKELLSSYYDEAAPIDGWVEYGYREVFKIYKFIALVELGFTNDAVKLSMLISKNNIAFYFRKTFWILYLHSYLKTIKNAEEIDAIRNEISTLNAFLYPSDKRFKVQERGNNPRASWGR